MCIDDLIEQFDELELCHISTDALSEEIVRAPVSCYSYLFKS